MNAAEGAGGERGEAVSHRGEGRGDVAEGVGRAAPPEAGTDGGAMVDRMAELAPLYGAAVAVLTWGFRLGAALLVVGLVVALARREELNRSADPFAEVLPAVFDGRAAGVVDLAIIWLMGTPVAAVLVVAGGFFRLGDRRYGLLSLLVLAILGGSIALAVR